MKFNNCAIMLIAILGMIPLSYAETSSDKTTIKEVKQETQDLILALDEYTAEQKDEAIAKTKVALDKLDKRIEALEERVDKSWDEMDKDARQKARDGLKALRKQRNEVAEWYGSLKNSSKNAWENMKEGFSDAYKSINTAWGKFEKEYFPSK